MDSHHNRSTPAKRHAPIKPDEIVGVAQNLGPRDDDTRTLVSAVHQGYSDILNGRVIRYDGSIRAMIDEARRRGWM